MKMYTFKGSAALADGKGVLVAVQCRAGVYHPPSEEEFDGDRLAVPASARLMPGVLDIRDLIPEGASVEEVTARIPARIFATLVGYHQTEAMRARSLRVGARNHGVIPPQAQRVRLQAPEGLDTLRAAVAKAAKSDPDWGFVEVGQAGSRLLVAKVPFVVRDKRMTKDIEVSWVQGSPQLVSDLGDGLKTRAQKAAAFAALMGLLSEE